MIALQPDVPKRIDISVIQEILSFFILSIVKLFLLGLFIQLNDNWLNVLNKSKLAIAFIFYR